MPCKGCSRLRRILIACIIGAAVFAAASGSSEVSEKLISLEFRDKPLGEVLQRLAGETGFTFLYDQAWSGHRVSAALEKVPIQAGLRRILGSLNHALVYLPNRTVKIVILEKAPPQSDGSPAGRAGRAPARKRPAPSVAPAPAQPQEAPASQEPEPPPQEQPPTEEAPEPESQPAP